MQEIWLCPYCDNRFLVLQSCAMCGPCAEYARCPRCSRVLQRPARMTFISGIEDD